MSDDDLLSKAIKSILDGEALLLTGSGASWGAKNELNLDFPIGSGLSEALFKKCKLYPSDDLSDAADSYIEKFGEEDLIRTLKSMLNVSSIQEWHKTVFSQPWRGIYTTNYDRVPVIAAKLTGKTLFPITLDKTGPQYFEQKDKCVYINGIIDNLNQSTLNSQFKLNSNSYQSSENFSTSVWSKIFEGEIDAAKYVFIVGLSLDYDLDLQRSYRSNVTLKDKTIIITSPTPGANALEEEKIKFETTVRKLGRFGKVFPIGIEGLADKIEKISVIYTPHKITTYLYTCFERYVPKANTEDQPKPVDIYDLFVNGQIKEVLLAKKNGKFSGLVNRHELNEIKEIILNNKKIIYIHSDFGNGKSILLEQIADIVSRNGIEVYIFRHDYPTYIQRDIDALCGDGKQKLIIFDSFNNYKHILKKISFKNTNNLTLVLAIRSGLMASLRLEIDELFLCKESESFIFDINKLSKHELRQLNEIFEKNGLWGDSPYKKYNQRVNYLENKKGGNSEFQTILLDRLESKNIKDKVSEIITSIRSSSKLHYDALLTILLARILTLDLSSGDINSIIGYNIIRDEKFSANAEIMQILQQRQSDGLYVAKSSITSRVILHSVSNMHDIIDSLLKIARYCMNYSTISRYYNILRNIISFSLISTFVKGLKNSHDLMLHYYELLAVERYYEKNQFFWLQFAMTLIKVADDTLDRDSYLRAYRYLKNARSLIDDDCFVPFQINNQEARLLFKIIMAGFSENIKDDFKKAHDLLQLPITSSKDRPKVIISIYRYYLSPNLETKFCTPDLKSFYFSHGREAYNNLSRLKKQLSASDSQECELLMQDFFKKFASSK